MAKAINPTRIEAQNNYKQKAPKAGMAEQVDALALGASAARHRGSTPLTRTRY